MATPSEEFWRIRSMWRREENGQWFPVAQSPITVLVPEDVHRRISNCDALQAPIAESTRDRVRLRRRGPFRSLRSWLAQRKIMGEQ